MTILLDYSGGQLTGPAVAGAGGSGVIRYAGTPGRTKNTTPGEVANLRASGREVHGCFENTTLDFTGGSEAGVANAKALLADANHCGITGVLFMTVDQHISGSQIYTWQQYVQGAATVLGHRLGVYGFSEAMIAARPYAYYFWQAGAHPSVTGTVAFVNVWQRNSGQTQMTVSGIPCDINDVLIPLSFGGPDVNLTDALPDPKSVAGTGTVQEALTAVLYGIGGKRNGGSLADAITELTARVDALSVPAAPVVDVVALAAALIPHLAPSADPIAIATAVWDEYKAQLTK